MDPRDWIEITTWNGKTTYWIAGVPCDTYEEAEHGAYMYIDQIKRDRREADAIAQEAFNRALDDMEANGGPFYFSSLL